MEGDTNNLIEGIQSSGSKAALVVSGGAIGAVHALLSHPGASRFVFEVQVPYSPEALFDYLGKNLEQACSIASASAMAERAFERARIFSRWNKGAVSILGISCTAALQTNRERKGADRAFVCIKSHKKEVSQELDVFPGSRAEQDAQLSAAFLRMLSQFVLEKDE